MNYVGLVFEGGKKHPTGVVQRAILEGKHLAADWKEGDWIGHLEADSSDGERFAGKYDYAPPWPGEFALRLYQSTTEVVLFGDWKNYTGDEGTWLFLLTPATKPAPIDFDSLVQLFSGRRSQ